MMNATYVESLQDPRNRAMAFPLSYAILFLEGLGGVPVHSYWYEKVRDEEGEAWREGWAEDLAEDLGRLSRSR